jgi:hypothetical protein
MGMFHVEDEQLAYLPKICKKSHSTFDKKDESMSILVRSFPPLKYYFPGDGFQKIELQ